MPAAHHDLLGLLKSRSTTTPDGCWEWTGATSKAGYGQIRVNYRARTVHRLSASLHPDLFPGFDIDDSSIMVCHHCDNPPCFNPAHLFLGTQQTNMADASAKHRTVLPGMRGATHPRGTAKLTEQDVSMIRTLRAQGLLLREIADRFDVHVMTVSDITRGKSWPHVT